MEPNKPDRYSKSSKGKASSSRYTTEDDKLYSTNKDQKRSSELFLGIDEVVSSLTQPKIGQKGSSEDFLGVLYIMHLIQMRKSPSRNSVVLMIMMLHYHHLTIARKTHLSISEMMMVMPELESAMNSHSPRIRKNRPGKIIVAAAVVPSLYFIFLVFIDECITLLL